MKSILPIIIAVIASLVIAALVAFVSVQSMVPKIYIADLAKIQNNYWKLKESDDELKAAMEKDNAELNKMNEALENYSQAVQEIRARFDKALSDDERKRIDTDEGTPALKRWQEKRDEMEKFATEARQRHQTQAQAKLQEIRKDIFEAVQILAVGKGATYVLEKGAIFYGSPDRDITDDVIVRLNKTAPIVK